MRKPVSVLKKRREFLRVARSKRKWVAPGLILQARPHGPTEALPPGASRIRVGFTASRKVGNAVIRNRVRRRLRAAVDRLLPSCVPEGWDFVVIGRAATAKRPFAALVADLEKGLKRLGAHDGAAGRRKEKKNECLDGAGEGR